MFQQSNNGYGIRKGYAMKIYNITKIYDDGECITIVTDSGAIHLPMNSNPSITIQPMTDPADNYVIIANIDLYQE